MSSRQGDTLERYDNRERWGHAVLTGDHMRLRLVLNTSPKPTPLLLYAQLA